VRVRFVMFAVMMDDFDFRFWFRDRLDLDRATGHKDREYQTDNDAAERLHRLDCVSPFMGGSGTRKFGFSLWSLVAQRNISPSVQVSLVGRASSAVIRDSIAVFAAAKSAFIETFWAMMSVRALETLLAINHVPATTGNMTPKKAAIVFMLIRRPLPSSLW